VGFRHYGKDAATKAGMVYFEWALGGCAFVAWSVRRVISHGGSGGRGGARKVFRIRFPGLSPWGIDECVTPSWQIYFI